MIVHGVRLTLLALMIFVMVIMQACTITPYEHGSIDSVPIVQRAVVQEQGAFIVRASVPSKEEAKKIFGIPIYRRGIQPVWLEITNNSSSRARFIVSSVDPEYFSPLEVAYMHKKYFSKQGWMDMEKFLYANTIPRMIDAGATESGFVFTHASNGTKSFNVDVFPTRGNLGIEEFTFFVKVPGFVPDHAEIDFDGLYNEDEVLDISQGEVDDMLKTLPCCTTNRGGDGRGMPANVVLVGTGIGVLRALLRAGWTENSYEKNDIYLNNSNYLYGRPPDATFRKSRGNSTERNELSLWLAPIRVDGERTWIGQIKHAVGRRFEISETFFGTALDPNVDDGRNYLLQNLWYSHSLLAFAYSRSGLEVPSDQPAMDFANNPFFSDGIRIVMWISGGPVALTDVRNLNWHKAASTAGDKQ